MIKINVWFLDFKTGQHDWKAIEKAAKRKIQCSCWMCGNPRKHWKGKSKNALTIQERREFQGDLYEDLENSSSS